MSNGHLNALIPDHQSYVTGHGAHDRVIACLPEGKELYLRVDHKWNLGMPTEEQMLAVANECNGPMRGKWKLDRTEQHDNGCCTDVFFRRV